MDILRRPQSGSENTPSVPSGIRAEPEAPIGAPPTAYPNPLPPEPDPWEIEAGAEAARVAVTATVA